MNGMQHLPDGGDSEFQCSCGQIFDVIFTERVCRPVAWRCPNCDAPLNGEALAYLEKQAAAMEAVERQGVGGYLSV